MLIYLITIEILFEKNLFLNCSVVLARRCSSFATVYILYIFILNILYFSYYLQSRYAVYIFLPRVISNNTMHLYKILRHVTTHNVL